MARDYEDEEMPEKKGKAPGHTHDPEHDKFLHKAMPHGEMSEEDCKE